MKQKFIEWADSLTVGVEEIDEQHKGLIDVTNNLYEAYQDGAVIERFRETLQIALDYVTNHFSTEEKIMREIRYPEYEIHCKEHDLFVAEVTKGAASIAGNLSDTAEEFMLFLKRWIAEHITRTDKRIGEYLAQNGQ
ncbi:MAG: bacteriohemerythrin [Treponema sp.]|nr:bacteriohemerythrin [Treponema sp.]